jgi:hypothetical protein
MLLIDLPLEINFKIIKLIGILNLDQLFWTNKYLQSVVLNYLRDINKKYYSELTEYYYEFFYLNYCILNNIKISMHYSIYYNLTFELINIERYKNKNFNKIFADNLTRNEIVLMIKKNINNHKLNILKYKNLKKKELKYYKIMLLYPNRIENIMNNLKVIKNDYY